MKTENNKQNESDSIRALRSEIIDLLELVDYYFDSGCKDYDKSKFAVLGYLIMQSFNLQEDKFSVDINIACEHLKMSKTWFLMSLADIGDKIIRYEYSEAGERDYVEVEFIRKGFYWQIIAIKDRIPIVHYEKYIRAVSEEDAGKVKGLSQRAKYLLGYLIKKSYLYRTKKIHAGLSIVQRELGITFTDVINVSHELEKARVVKTGYALGDPDYIILINYSDNPIDIGKEY